MVNLNYIIRKDTGLIRNSGFIWELFHQGILLKNILLKNLVQNFMNPFVSRYLIKAVNLLDGRQHQKTVLHGTWMIVL